MTAINFKSEFSSLIVDGRKTHTIRKRRKYPIKKGDWLQLYIGMRTKSAKMMMQRQCTDVQPIIIDRVNEKVIIGDAHLNNNEIEQLAIEDGFENSNQFFFFFAQYPDEVLEKDMVIIHWGKQ